MEANSYNGVGVIKVSCTREQFSKAVTQLNSARSVLKTCAEYRAAARASVQRDGCADHSVILSRARCLTRNE